MHMRGHHWSRIAATSALSLLTAAAVILHQQADSDSAKGIQPATADPHAGHIMPEAVPVAVTTAAPLPRTGWTASADSAASAADRVLDGNAGTSWKSESGSMPHSITIDTHNRIALSGLTYMPSDGADGRIGRYQVQISDDGSKWSANVATGTFADDDTVKTITIGTTVTRYVKLTVLSEAGDRVSWTSAAEINLLGGTDPALPRTGWTVAADSQETAKQASPAVNAIDGNTATIWHSAWSSKPPKALPHTFTIDMHKNNLVSGLSYLPRQDASNNGNIGSYKVETSLNGTLWTPQSITGQFGDLKTAQTVTIPSQIARYVRLTATSEAGNRGPWSSAAEFNVLG